MTANKRIALATILLALPAFANANQDANPNVNQDVNTDETQVEKVRVIGTVDSGIQLSTKKILKVPGAGNDPLRAVESLPGVVLANGFAPAVRGSSPRDMYYETDGVPVGAVFHNDGTSTLYPNLIRSFELKTGAWESEFFDATGGIITTSLRDPVIDDLNVELDLSFLRVGGMIESKINDTSAFYFAARQSVIHLYIESVLDEEDFQFTQAPINNDYQFKYLNILNPDNRIVIQATGSDDDVGLLFADDSDEVLQNPDLSGGLGFEQYFNNQSIIWTNESSFGETKVIANRLERSSDIVIGQIVDIDAVNTETLLKIHNTNSVGDGILKSGVDYRQASIDYIVSGKLSPCNDEFEVCPPTYFAPEATEIDTINVDFYTIFADYDFDVSDNTTLRLGAVNSSNTFNDENFFEPRISAKYRLNSDYQLSVAYGQHHQWFREYKYLSETFGAVNLKQLQSTHWTAGIQYEGQSEWAWKLDLYSKEMDNLIISNPDATSSAQYLNGGIGDAYGVEFLLNKAISNDWYGWLSIAYSKTKRTNTLTGDDFAYQFDKPLIINAVMNYDLNNGWELGARWRYQSGALYTPITGADAVLDQQNEVIFYDPIEGGFNSQRLENFHRLDVRADYKMKLFGKQSSLYFEVLNVYGQKSITGYDYNPDYTDREENYQFPEAPLPSIGVRIEL